MRHIFIFTFLSQVIYVTFFALIYAKFSPYKVNAISKKKRKKKLMKLITDLIILFKNTEPRQTSTMELFAKISNSFMLLSWFLNFELYLKHELKNRYVFSLGSEKKFSINASEFF